MEAVCVPGSIIFRDQYRADGYNCIFRTPVNEFPNPPVGGVVPEFHYHDFYEIIFFLGEAGVFRTPGGDYPVGYGDIVINNIFRPHTLAYDPARHYERFSVCIDPGLLFSFCTKHSNLLDIFTQRDKDCPVLHNQGERFTKYLAVLDGFRKIQLEQGQDVLERALIQQLLAYLYSDCYDQFRGNDLESQHTAVIVRLVEYINRHLEEELPLEKLAQQANYSVYHTCKVFKKATGQTLTNYIIEKRMERVMRSIGKGSPVTQAAQAAGFHNYSYFYKLFRRKTGMSPAEYQEAMQAHLEQMPEREQ